MRKHQIVSLFSQNILDLQRPVYHLVIRVQPFQSQLKRSRSDSNHVVRFWILPKSFGAWYHCVFDHEGPVFRDFRKFFQFRRSGEESLLIPYSKQKFWSDLQGETLSKITCIFWHVTLPASMAFWAISGYPRIKTFPVETLVNNISKNLFGKLIKMFFM